MRTVAWMIVQQYVQPEPMKTVTGKSYFLKGGIIFFSSHPHKGVASNENVMENDSERIRSCSGPPHSCRTEHPGHGCRWERRIRWSRRSRCSGIWWKRQRWQ